MKDSPPTCPHVADVLVCPDLSIKQPELIMPKRAHQVFRQQSHITTASHRKTVASLDIY